MESVDEGGNVTLYGRMALTNVELQDVIDELTAELIDTRKDRDTAEREVKELKATIEEILKELIQMMEYIRGR